jgi:peptidoglycan/xylan/chitin deacetylase (PgdA/CDA1 family)
MTKAVPILTYHHVNPLEGDMVTVSVKHFEDQMSFLQRKGFHTLFISELVDWMEGKRTLPKRSVVLTFDDGFWDNFHFAFPILRKYGLKATIFVTTSWLSDENRLHGSQEVVPHHQCNQLIAQGLGNQIAMTWPEVRQLQDSSLVEIESHTHSHNKELYQNVPALKEDLRRSKEAILNHLNKITTCLCWPGGRYSSESILAAQEVGFTALCTTERGLNQPGSDLLRLKRVTVKDDGFQWLRKTMFIFSQPPLGKMYATIKPK